MHRRPPRRGEDGSVSAELVVATPLMLLLILAVVQFALWQHATHIAQAAAQQGLDVGRVHGGTTTAAQAQADAVLTQLGTGVLQHPAVTAIRTGATTSVVVTGQVEAVIPFLHLPVRSVATGPTEVFHPDVAAVGP